MASYHLRLKTDTKPDGSRVDAIAHTEYVNREGKYQDYDAKREIQEHLSNNYIFTQNKNENFNTDFAPLYYTDDFGSIAATKNGIQLTRKPSSITMSIALLIADKSSEHSPLSLNGSKKFQEFAIETAAENNLDIKFADENLQKKFIHQKEIIENEQRKFVESGGKYIRADYRNREFIDSRLEGNTISTDIKSNLDDLKGKQGTISDFTKRGFCMSTLSERNVVSIGENAGVLLSDNAHIELDELSKRIYQTVRWDATGARRKLADNTANQIVDEVMYGKNGHIAEEHLAYINRDEIYKKKGGCVMTGSQLPKWAKGSAKTFFAAADKYEAPENRRYLELELSLPNELTLEENKKILDEFLANHLKNHYYAWAIHEKEGLLSGEKHPHVHIMFSEREIDVVEKTNERSKSVYFKNASTKGPSREHGAKKDKKWHNRYYIREIRADFAHIQNEALKRNGFSITVDHRSLKEQQAQALAEGDAFLANLLARVPEEFIGVVNSIQTNNEKVKALLARRATVKEYRETLYAAEKLKREISDLKLKDKTSNALINADEFLKSVQFEDAKNTIDVIDELENDVVKAVEEVNLWKRYFITAEEAEMQAKEEYMSQEEKDIFYEYKEIQGRLNNWNELLNNLRENDETKNKTLDVQNALERKIEDYNIKMNLLQKKVDVINAKFSKEEYRKKIQNAANNIIKENDDYHKELEKATAYLEKTVENLKRVIRDDEIKNDTKEIFMLKEMYDILRRKYFGYQKELKKLQDLEKDLRKKVISEPRARLIAEGVVLKKAPKELRERERKYKKKLQYLNNDVMAYEKELEFLSTEKYKKLSVEEKNQIQEKLNNKNLQLNQRKNELKTEEEYINTEKNRIDKLLSISENQEKIALIIASILKRNQGDVMRHQNIKTQIDNMKEKISQTKTRIEAVKNRMSKEKTTGYYKADILLAAKIYKVSASKFSLNASNGSSRTSVEAIADAMAGDKHTLPIIFHSTDIKLEKNWNLMSEWDKAEEAYHEMWKDI